MLVSKTKIVDRKEEVDKEDDKPKCVWDGKTDCPIRELFMIPSASDIDNINVPDFLKQYLDMLRNVTNMVDVTTEALEALHLWEWCRICPIHLKRLKELGIELKL